jgi:hypothetical protein
MEGQRVITEPPVLLTRNGVSYEMALAAEALLACDFFESVNCGTTTGRHGRKSNGSPW